MKLEVYASGGCLDTDPENGIVHQVVRIKVSRDGDVLRYRHFIACGVKLEDVPRSFIDTTLPNCMACLAQTTYRLKCRRGSCGKLQDPATMCIHRDTLEAYCHNCAIRINATNNDTLVVEMQTKD